MITITVTNDAEAAAATRIAEHAKRHDVNFNGATFEVERGDHLSIDGVENEYNGAALFADLLSEIAVQS